MERIGLLAAMPQEARPLLKYVGKFERSRSGACVSFQFQLGGKDCRLVQTGIGQARARLAVLALLDAGPVDGLVVFGVSGAVWDDLEVGDVVAAHHVCLLERGHPGAMLPLAELSLSAHIAAVEALAERGAAFYPGTVVTTAGPQAVLAESAHLPHAVLDMETAAVAEIAASRGIPLLVLRAVSDNPRQPLPFRIEDFLGAGDRPRIAKILYEMLRHPQVLPKSLRFLRNVRRASQNLASALAAGLEQPESCFGN